jgi:nondiscriminating glutamyl-tRNA synthetase
MLRTRFAPSPTGYLHIGGVRTALFNWLLARRHGGQFILRIDDTDDSRNRAEAVKPIIDGFQWLGMTWDEGPTPDASGDSTGPHKPYFQGQRNDKYEAAALRLLKEGKAYPDYAGKHVLEALRLQAQQDKMPFVYRGVRRNDPVNLNLQVYSEQPRAVLRLKVPDDEIIKFRDCVKGEIEVNSSTIGDPVILREPNEEGVCKPLYNFATVVDEVDFGITHVVRAIEHLSNTPPQILMYQALGAELPAFGHIPLVNYNGKKMSKRNLPPLSAEETGKLKACGWTDAEIAGRDDLNIATVAYYREIGYLPEALINYLCRLGWSMDGESEFIPLPTLIENFSLDRVTDAPGNYDGKKLFWLQGEYMKLVPTAEKVERCIPFLKKAKLIGDTLDDATRAVLTKIVDASADRIKLFSDIIAFAAPILKTEIEYSPEVLKKAFQDPKNPQAKELLREFAGVLKGCEPFDAPTTDKALHDFLAAKGVKPNFVVQPVRAAVTGSLVGFGLFDTLAILGKETSLKRIEKALHVV